jgi:hypothetical protein
MIGAICDDFAGSIAGAIGAAPPSGFRSADACTESQRPDVARSRTAAGPRSRPSATAMTRATTANTAVIDRGIEDHDSPASSTNQRSAWSSSDSRCHDESNSAVPGASADSGATVMAAVANDRSAVAIRGPTTVRNVRSRVENGAAEDSLSTSELGLVHMDPPGPVPGAGDGMLLTGLPAEALDAALAAAGPGVDSPLLSVEFRQLGGAIAPGATDGGCIAGFDAEFAMFAVGFTPTPESAVAVRTAVDGVQHRLAPWSTGSVYLNFAERFKAPTAIFGAETYRRLQQVKLAYDPADVIRSNHAVRLP